jgi:starch synthase
LRTLYDFDPVLRNRAVVQTVHNAGHQGRFPADTVEKLLFPWDIFTMERVEFYNEFNFLKGGIVYSDFVTTVSPRYAEEIQTQEYGAGLDGVFRRRAPELKGILNGVDYRQWNPAKDGNIAAHYTPENLEGKAVCRKDLLHAFGAGAVNESTAVLGMVTRLTTQKGIDLLAESMDALMREDVVLTVLGTGEEYYENLLRSLAEQYAGRVLVRILYDETLAHKVKAGADMLLMPSRYEPCGLTQFHAMKYGTVPVVHATGGLDDTVEEWNAEARTGTGFKFQGFEAEKFVGAVRGALAVFREKGAWAAVMRNAMAKDFSWGPSAKEYVEVYERAVRGRL